MPFIKYKILSHGKNLITLIDPFCLDGPDGSGSRYSIIIQSVFTLFVGFPAKKAKAFFTPIFLDPEEANIDVSFPIAFQKPEPADLLGLDPFGYFLSLGVKKNHSSFPNNAFPTKQTQNVSILNEPNNNNRNYKNLTRKIPWVIFV